VGKINKKSYYFKEGGYCPLFIYIMIDIYNKRKDMDINVNHPSVVKFLSEITQTIVSNISVENYFKLTDENKLGISYAVLKLVKNSADQRTKLSDLEFRALLSALWKKNEENENYEVAAILTNINKNYETISEIIKTTKRVKKETKTNITNNG
jgi:hypothetical protein